MPRTGVTGSFSSIKQAQAYFRTLWKKALAEGLQPGQPLQEQLSVQRLAEGHPDYADMTRAGIDYFTIAPDGRGNHRFVLVDKGGMHHPFSTLAALRGAKTPLRLPLEEARPFKDLR